MPDDASLRPLSLRRPRSQGLVKNASRVAMAVGVVGGYGGFAAISGRYLYPARTGEVMWQFVTEVAGVRVGEAIRYRDPRRGDQHRAHGAGRWRGRLHRAVEHLPSPGLPGALGVAERPLLLPVPQRSVRPVRRGDRRTSGEAGQSLPRYELKVERGLLHIAVPPPRFADAGGEATHQAGIVRNEEPVSGPGHDPCLGCGDGGRKA